MAVSCTITRIKLEADDFTHLIPIKSILIQFNLRVTLAGWWQYSAARWPARARVLLIASVAAETTADAWRCPVAQCRDLATVTVKHSVWSIQATNNYQAGVQLWLDSRAYLGEGRRGNWRVKLLENIRTCEHMTSHRECERKLIYLEEDFHKMQ